LRRGAALGSAADPTAADPARSAAGRRLELRLDQDFRGHQRFQELLQLINAPTDQLCG